MEKDEKILLSSIEDKAEKSTATALKRAEILKDLKLLYESENGSWGSFEEAEEKIC